MKKLLLIAIMAVLLPFVASAQYSISGKVTQQDSGNGMPGATITLLNTSFKSQTNTDGSYSISGLAQGDYTVIVTYVGYQREMHNIKITQDFIFNVALKRSSVFADEVIVRATRANSESATTYKNLDKAELEKNNLGQDLPYLLNQTPSVVVSSDAGAGVGYTGIRIRGSDATRINVTVNGIPLNDAESQGSFFINLPDFASSVDNIQIQRGVGTSTNGAGAFGASLNIQTTTRRDSAYAELNNTFGSYNTWKNTVNIGSGLINNKFTFDGRLSQIKSDGYIERASSNLKSFFLSGAYYGKKDQFRANVFSGKEKTYQAWNGVPEELLQTNRRYNEFTYDNQTDNYQQDHYQAFYTHLFSDKLNANAALHYTYGRGYYEEFKDDRALADYNIAPVVVGGETITNSDLVRQLWLNNHFYGATYSLNYTPSNKFNFTLGGGYNEYKGAHYGEVIWAQFANYDVGQTNSINHRYYDNDAKKTDFNVFGKGTYRLDKFSLYADLQYRRVNYSFLGFDRNQNNTQQQAELDFFNPKAGITYFINSKSNVYASFAVGNKEPNRNDFTESTPDSRPKHENLKDIEAGYRIATKNFTAGVNGYAMLYNNQLVVTGEINDVGSATRMNAKDSYRMGFEFDGKWLITDKFHLAATATLSRNKIKSYTQFIYDDNFAENGIFSSTEYSNTNIAFSPDLIASSEIGFKPIKRGEIALLSKYITKQYLDNTQDDTRILPSYFVNDLRLSYTTSFSAVKNIGVSMLINNIFRELYSANGYTYNGSFDGELYRGNGYYPQAPRNFLLALSLKF